MSVENLKFLIVEDHDFQRRALMQLLSNLGALVVHCAQDGAAALQVVRDPDRSLDIVISDLSMPGMDGMEFIRHLSEADSGLSLILTSALEPALLTSVAEMAQAYGVNLLGVMSKPVTAVKLAPMIEIHHARRRQAAPLTARRKEFDHEEIAQAWNSNAFECLLQPRVDLRTGALVGVKVAPFWRHPTRGVLTASTFLPWLQAEGLSDDLAWRTLRHAATLGATLHQRGLRVKMAVNLAFTSMTDIHLAERVQLTIAKENLDPRHLVLGITESSVNTDAARALENLVRLRVAGFGLSVDDFGSGQMSPEQIARIAFTELAIHRNFVAGAWPDDLARAVLATGLDLAKKLGLLAVADGVDSREDRDFLRDWGCDVGQGDYFSPALPLEAFVEWAAAWHPMP